MDPDVMLLKVDDEETIVATVKPSKATNKRVTWSSSDETVATVDANGKVTAVAGGTATITVTTRDGGYTATKQVVVGDLLVPAGTSIQEVIRQAEEGNWVVVAPSDVPYEGFMVSTDNITVKAVGNAVISTVYQPGTVGGGGDVGVLINGASDVVIDGFIIKDEEYKEKSMGLTVFGSGSVTVSGCTFENLTRGIYANSNANYGIYPVTIIAKDNTFETGVGIGGTENTVLTVSGNTFETTVEAIGIGDNATVEIEDLYSSNNSFNVKSGDCVVDYRDGTVKYDAGGRFLQMARNQNTKVFYSTIQAAIDAAQASDTILVGPGEYEDNLLIDKYILLIGDSNGETKLRPKEDKPVIKLAASGQSHENPLLLKNIDIYTNNVGGHDYGKMTGIMIEGDDTSIAHIRLENIAIVGNNHSYTGSTFEYGLHVRLGVDLSDLVITGSSFSKLSYGMFVGQVKSDDPGSLDEVEICDTVFESNSNKGMYVEKLSNATLTDVSFINNGTLDLIEGDWARPYLAGLDINLKYGTYENIALNNLTVVDNGLKAKDGVGVAIKARDDGSYNANAATLRNVVINGGVFRSNERGLRFGEPGKDNLGPTKVTIRNVAFMGETPQYEGVDGSRYGALVNETLATIDAAGNYWGHESGPYHSLSNPDGQGDSVSDGVVFFPWYVDEGMSGVSPYEKGIINARDLSSYKSIQLAIEKAQPDDTIFVSEGTYTGNLQIGKNLSLVSTDGVGATSIKGNITIKGDDVTNVTIEGFTIDGKVEGPEGFDPQAIFDNNGFPVGSRIIGNKIMVPAENTIYNVMTGTEYQGIKAAVTEAEPGDTILVGSGTYEEDLVIAVENLTLVSVEKHAAIIETQGDFEPGLGYGGITILADGVTIDGFKIKQSVAQAIVHTHNADGVTIKNNSISGIEPSRGIDIGYASAGSNSVTVEGNEFADLYCGVYVNQGNNLVVESNVFNGMNGGAVVFDGTWGNTNNITVKDNEAKGAEYLLYFYDAIGSVAVEGNDLTNTKLSNYGVYNSELGKYFPTLQAAVGAASTGDTLLVAPGDYDEILEVKNKSLTIVGLDKENTKVKAISAYPGSSNDLVIKNLTVYGNNGSGQSYAGVYIANGNVTIDGCNIHGTDRIYHGIMTETGNTGNVIIQNCDLLGYKWPYFNPSQGSIMLEGNDFHGSGPSIDGFTNVTVTGNRNMSIGLAIGYGLLNKEHGEVLDGLSSELKAFAVMLHSENTDVVVKLSTNDTDTGAWGGYYTGLDEEGNLTITEQYLSK